MQRVILPFFIFSVLSFGIHSGNEEQVIFDRIIYIYNLKGFVNKEVWPGFTDNKFDLPLIYFTDSNCYVANPTVKFIALLKPLFVLEDQGVKIYKTHLLDSLPFHMETRVAFDPPSAFNYNDPFMNCSSFEITQKTIPDVNSTEQWSTMILHEYFHGFQFKHREYLDFFKKNIGGVAEDTLKKIYRAYPWFKESVDKENETLLEALKQTEKKKINDLISSFFQLREQRRLQTKQQIRFDIQPIEETYETMEGTARSVEYSLYNHFSDKKPDEKLVRHDTAYHAYEYFRNYNMEKDNWLYLTERGSYFYATGFNITRLLDKLKVPYKKRLFNEGGLSLEQILREYASKKK